MGEIAAADRARCAFWTISASSKNALRPCAQQKAAVVGTAFRPGVKESAEPTIGVGLKDTGKVLKIARGMFAARLARG
jgi:hypothetical protein